MLSWFVFLMPDGELRAQLYYSHVEPWEQEALDCWIMKGDNAESVCRERTLRLYHHLQAAYAKGYR